MGRGNNDKYRQALALMTHICKGKNIVQYPFSAKGSLNTKVSSSIPCTQESLIFPGIAKSNSRHSASILQLQLMDESQGKTIKNRSFKRPKQSRQSRQSKLFPFYPSSLFPVIWRPKAFEFYYFLIKITISIIINSKWHSDILFLAQLHNNNVITFSHHQNLSTKLLTLQFNHILVDPWKHCPCNLALAQKKKYSKVNDPLRVSFLEMIVQNNMSIKEASLSLNINYSSAKAILAHHRKTLINSNKVALKGSKRAEFRTITTLEGYLNPIEEFVCTTGGKEAKRFSTQMKHKPIHKAPIILLAVSKDYQCFENTSNSHTE